MPALGTHVLLDLEGCASERLADAATVRRALREAALRCGATIVGEAFHEFDPPGVSGVLLLAESHLSIHTWPDAGSAAIDAFSCSETFDAVAAASRVAAALGATREHRVVVPRGQGACPSVTSARGNRV